MKTFLMKYESKLPTRCLSSPNISMCAAHNKDFFLHGHSPTIRFRKFAQRHRYHLNFSLHYSFSSHLNALYRARASSESYVAFSYHVSGFLQSAAVLPSLLDFCDLHTLRDHGPVIQQMFPQFGFLCCFLMITFWSVTLGSEATELRLRSFHYVLSVAQDFNLFHDC